MLRSGFFSSSICVIGLDAVLFAAAQQPTVIDQAATDRVERHSSVEWLTVAPHLPNPQTASPVELETAGDVLRARRLPADAIDYFKFAIQRGGNEVELTNRIGVTELEQNQLALARACFKRVLILKRKYAEGWNNLGATEDMSGNMKAAIGDYLHAVKLNRKNAIFHANLGTAYFGASDYESARHEFDVAAKLDPGIFHRGGFGGSLVHVLSGDDRGRFAFEMARIAAGHGEDESMLHWLAVSIEGGYDVGSAMTGLKDFNAYRKDPRITLLLHNAKAMRARQLAVTEPVPVLPPPTASKD
jgi:tetratricopeptide (TPR) repeat protein